MLEVPDFVRLADRQCEKCKCRICSHDVTNIGLYRGELSGPAPGYIFVHANCPRCKRRNFFHLDACDWLKFAVQVADWCWRKHLLATVQVSGTVKATRVRKKGRALAPISDAEVEEARKLLHGAETRQEVMQIMGLTPEQIEAYTKP